MATFKLPRYFTLKNEKGEYFTLSAVLGFLPLHTFSSKQPTRLSVFETLYNPNDKAVMVRSGNGRFWSFLTNKENQGTIAADKEQMPDPSDKKSHFKAVKTAKGMVQFQTMTDGRNAFDPAVVSNAENIAVAFPSYVMFQGNNEKFLSVPPLANTGDEWLTFDSSSRNLQSTFKVVTLVDGNFIFQSVQNKNYWRRGDGDYIKADADLSTAMKDKYCQFDVSKLSKSLVVIKCIGDELRRDGEKLIAAKSSIEDAATHLTVVDATNKRHIFNVKYMLDVADLSDIQPIVVGRGSVVNNGYQKADLLVQVHFTETVQKSNRWMTSQTLGLETSLTITAGIPEVASAEIGITVGVEKTTETELGSANTTEVGFLSGYLIKDVAPGTEASVAVECSIGKCRIPFTYTTKATRVDGVDLAPEDMIDGVYEGVSVFNTRGVISGSKPAAASTPPTGAVGKVVGGVVQGTTDVAGGLAKGVGHVAGGVTGGIANIGGSLFG